MEVSQYMTFKLGDELFAINVSQVREVLEVPLITKIPNTPDYMSGVVNVRGQSVPVVDLRLRFGLSKIQLTVNTRIIVMELQVDGEPVILGGMADSVHEVIGIEPSSINPPPQIAQRWKTEFIQGLGRREDDFIILLDVNAVFSSDDLLVLQEKVD